MPKLGNTQFEHSKSPWRLRKSFSIIKLLSAKEVTVNGLDALQNIDNDHQVIIATTHRTDLDLPLSVFELSNYMDVALTDMSLNHKLGSPGSRFDRLGLIAIGESCFIPIDFQNTPNGKQVPGLFNPDNFIPMAMAMKEGKNIVVSAQNPSSTHKFDKPGIAVPYLAAITGASVLPVSVTQLDESKRPSFNITISNTIGLQQIPTIDAIKYVIDTLNGNERPTEHDIKAFRVAKLALQFQAQVVVDTLNRL